MDIRISVDHEDLTPTRAHESDAGLDLKSSKPLILYPGEHELVPTGVSVDLPPGTVGMVCSRSGLAAKHGVHVLNAPGIVDSGFKGEVKVNLHNAGQESYVVCRGDRIAQLVVVPFLACGVVELNWERGVGGHGSTGK